MNWLLLPANLFFLTLIALCYHILQTRVRHFGYLQLYGVVWFVVIIGSQLAGPVYAPQLQTLVLFYLAWLCFLLPSFHFFTRTTDGLVAQGAPEPDTNRLKRVLIVLLSLSVAVNLNMVYRIAGDLNLWRFGWLALRIQGQALVGENSSVLYQLFARCFVIYIPIAVVLFRRKALSRAGLAGVCLIALATAGIGLTRAPILCWAVTLLISLSIVGGMSRRLWITVSALLISPFILVFSVLGYNWPTFGAVAALYGFGGSKAYEQILAGRYGHLPVVDSRYYSLDFVHYTLNKLGLIGSYPPLVRSYASRPATNVYTYLDAFTLDFGVVGAVCCAGLMGALAAYTHRRAYATHRPAAMALYAYVCYAIVMSFMNMELIRISGWLLLAELWVIDRFVTVRTTPVFAR